MYNKYKFCTLKGIYYRLKQDKTRCSYCGNKLTSDEKKYYEYSCERCESRVFLKTRKTL